MKGKRQKAKGKGQKVGVAARLLDEERASSNTRSSRLVAQRHHPFAFCPLPFAFCLSFRPAFCLSLFLLALCALGCGRADPYAATERAIRRTLPTHIGPARSYAVRIARSGTNLLRGELSWIEIQGLEVRASPDLTVDDLLVRLDDIRVNRRTRTISSVGASAITARISAASATRYAMSRGEQFKGVRLEFGAGEVIVHATPALLGIRVPVRVAGRPVLRGEHAVDFDTSGLAVGILPLPRPLLSLLESRINPILDLKALNLPLHLNGVRIEPGYAVVTGTARFSVSP